MINTVIFDMDGVIINSEPVHQKLEFQMFDELNLKISREEHKHYVGTSAVDMWTLIGDKHELSRTPEELLIYGRELYWDALENGEVHLVQGVLALIGEFSKKKFTIQVASSATRPTVDKVLEHFYLEHFFQYRIGGDEVRKSKPDPEIFIRAAHLSQSEPEHCLVIEDSANGVRAAKDAGMKCIGYANEHTGNQNLSNADLIIHSMDELTVEVIQGL